jgi:hypothetical protein
MRFAGGGVLPFTSLFQQLCESRAHSTLEVQRTICAQLQALNHDTPDMHMHAHARTSAAPGGRKSASFTGRSNFRNSIRAESISSSMVTGVSAPTARKAALSAML